MQTSAANTNITHKNKACVRCGRNHEQAAYRRHQTQTPFQRVVQQPAQPGDDRALPRALPQLRANPARVAGRQADHRHRPDRQRPFAMQPPSPGTRPSGPGGHPCRRRHCHGISDAPDPGDRQAPDRGARPQPRLSRAGGNPVRLPAGRRGPDHGLRQDHPRLPDGGGDGQFAGDRAVGLAEALGMSLPGCAAIPAPYRERGQIAYETGTRIVGMVWEDLKPSDILTRQAFENCIVVNSAIGGSTNAPIHINALARHIGVELDIDDWQKFGHTIPLLVNMQPAGFYLGEEYHRAGGVPAVVRELMAHKRIHEDAMTVNGHTMGENCRDAAKPDGDVIWTYDKPLVKDAGFLVLRGNLFDSAIMKTSVISKEFRDRYLINPKDPNAFEGRAIVFEGPEDYHHRIDDPALDIDGHCILFVRGTGPIGYPGGAEVVNMQPPAALIKRGILSLPCIGDGRQSGTSGSPSILNATPEAAADGGLAILKTGDRVRVDLNKGSANILISDEELKQRRAELKR